MKKSLIILLAANSFNAFSADKEIPVTSTGIQEIVAAIVAGQPNIDNIVCAPNMDLARVALLQENPAAFRSVNFSNSDLSGANLEGMDLSHANLNGTNLSNANLKNANLSNADLRHANLSGANIIGTDLTNALLNDVTIDANTIIDSTTKIDADIIPTSVLALKKVRKELKKAQVTLAALKDDAKEGLENAGQTVKKGLEKAKDGLEDAGATLKDGVETATENVKTGLSKAGETVKTELKKAKKDFLELPQNTKKFFKKTGKKVREFFS